MPISRTNPFGGELFVALDKGSKVPMHVQLETTIRSAIRSGRLVSETIVPPSRRLADELGLSRGVVVEAYQQLTAEGYLLSERGGYTRVASNVTAAPPPPAGIAGAGVRAIDFRYGRPDVSQFPRAAWLRSMRRVLAEAPHDRLNYLDGRGAPELRASLTEYLNRVRGTWTAPENVIPCNGYAQGILLLLSVLAARGIRRLAVEDPGDANARRVAAVVGLEVVGVPVTESGIDVGALEASGAEAVLVTPAHQFPTGAVLSPEARAALLAWATRTNALVIEDDYDAEYRYDQSPVGALHGLAPDNVIYAGTASKTLAPGLRLGWLVVPSRLLDDVVEAKIAVDGGSPVLDQLVFAEFVARGEFDRHLRKMRPTYRRRRDALLRALDEHLPELEPAGIAAGLHVFAWLPADLAQRAVAGEALERGLIIHEIGDYQLADSARGGLIFGYGKLGEEAIDDGVRVLRSVIDDIRMRTS